MKDDELLHKWVNGDINAEEMKVFKRRPEYKSLERLNKSTGDLAVPSFNSDEMLTNILTQDKTGTTLKTESKRRILTTWMKYAAAAAVLLFSFLFLWPQDNIIKYEAGRGEQKTGQLPNGSTFTLNAESSLAYKPESWDTERYVELEGEAFFEVEKGKPFTVQTINGMVEVLGTKFNVWSRNQTLEVKCQSGKVAVSAIKDPEKHILTKDEAIRISSEKASEIWKESTLISWTEGISKFKKVPLSTVLEELERQFDINIDARQVNTEEIISCSFDHNDLDLALKTSLSSLGIRYQINGHQIVLTQE